MDGLEKLTNWFETGQGIRPSAEEPNFVDLVRSLFYLAGVEKVRPDLGAEKISRMIGEADHHLFILIDGLGLDQMKILPDSGFLNTHLVRNLQSLFLSTTATTLTTLATGKWPCSHGVPGWWMYLAEPDLSVVTLPFVERMSKKPLELFGLAAEDLFPEPSLWPKVKKKVNPILPAQIAESTYTRYSFGSIRKTGYRDLDEAMRIAFQVISNAAKPSLTYLYLPQFDAVVHENGTGHEKARECLMAIDGRIRELHEKLSGKARFVISSDHGMIDVPEERKFVLSMDDPLMEHLRCVPSGEPCVPIFYVRPGYEDQFSGYFNSKFGDYFILLRPDQIERMRLLGPHVLSDVMKKRLGTFMAIAIQPTVLNVYIKDNPAHLHVGYHGGLSRSEMYIPLVLA